jgi:hypothetical protein
MLLCFVIIHYWPVIKTLKHCYYFNLISVNIGLFCSTPGVALSRAVPRKVAMEMLLTGHPISSQGEEILKDGRLFP